MEGKIGYDRIIKMLTGCGWTVSGGRKRNRIHRKVFGRPEDHVLAGLSSQNGIICRAYVESSYRTSPVPASK